MPPKIAFVVDALAAMAGGERVILQALELAPGAPVYAMVYNPDNFSRTLAGQHPVIPSIINRLPLARSHYRHYLPLMPYAVRQFDLSPFDLVVSFNYAVAHWATTHPGQRHLSYTFTPLRYAWRNIPFGRTPSPLHQLENGYLNAFRKWDTAAAARIDRFAAVSNDIAGWICQAYQRDAQVIYPPVEVDRFNPHLPRSQSYITVSRLVPHKHVELVVEAFSCLKFPLTVVGDGPELAHLRQIAAPNITFAGYQPDTVVADLLGRARAFVTAAEEDFGIAMVEAQAAGCPVIAYGKGGALETVIAEKTGLFFQERSTASLIDAIQRFEKQSGSFCTSDLQSNAARFSPERFTREFSAFLRS